jgi:hypothetical protein
MPVRLALTVEKVIERNQGIFEVTEGANVASAFGDFVSNEMALEGPETAPLTCVSPQAEEACFRLWRLRDPLSHLDQLGGIKLHLRRPLLLSYTVYQYPF